MEAFRRLASLPPYVFNTTGEMKAEARRRGEDIIDFGMGNPDGATPPHIVAKLIEAAARDSTHRYSLSKGIPRLRKAICDWYQRRYGVELDPNSEAIVTIGSKEGIAHLCLATLDDQDAILVPNPSYPIHIYGPTIAGAQVISVEMNDPAGFLDRLQHDLPTMHPRPKMLLLNFPANPTAQTVDRAFFERVVAFCRAEQIYLLHDFAYADLVFDGYRAPSVMEIPGAKDIAVEFFTLSKSYNMPGWRVGFMVGNRDLVGALTRIKSYFDYGTFTPIQVASIQALEGPQECVAQICDTYRKRRDALVRGLNQHRLASGKPEGHDVRLGSHSRAIPRSRLTRVRKEAATRCQDRRQPRHRLRPAWRRPRPLLADRKRRAHPPGHPRHPPHVRARLSDNSDPCT